ncbi:MAG: TIGR00300 family protein [Armatimonadota bacterium]|nr:TIGR00300 family protein [Armatimonadota bacterium]
MASELIELKGHIIDSLSLPRVLDGILAQGGRFEIEEIKIGKTRPEPSYARIRVNADSEEALENILAYVEKDGASRAWQWDADLAPAPKDGVFPEDFYCTTNLETQVRISGRWTPVRNIEMDCGIVVEDDSARTMPMNLVRDGQKVVVGHRGVRVEPPERKEPRGAFEFMTSEVSAERPKGLIVREIAHEIMETKRRGEKVLLVGGPAIIHSGAGPFVERMIECGYIDVLFAGNALPLHDIESALYGTSLGVSVEEGRPAAHGHEHHLRAVNTIRRIGSIKEAVRQGILNTGIMRVCVQANAPFVLAGSIRDDGPLPEVITDTMEAQAAMREALEGVGFALMVATTLHSVATGNLLPARVKVVCVDIDPAVVTKLVDRGTVQATGVVTDVGLFLMELDAELRRIGTGKEEKCLAS